MRTAAVPAGDLARVKSHDPNDEWPSAITITARWGDGRTAKRRSVEVDADMFFGRGQFGAPMSGEQLIGMIDRLRRQK